MAKAIVNRHIDSVNELSTSLFVKKDGDITGMEYGQIVICNDVNNPSIYILNSAGDVTKVIGGNSGSGSEGGGSYDDTALRAAINANTENISILSGKANDYDTILNGFTVSSTVQMSFADINALIENLIGEDSGKTIREIAAEEAAKVSGGEVEDLTEINESITEIQATLSNQENEITTLKTSISSNIEQTELIKKTIIDNELVTSSALTNLDSRVSDIENVDISNIATSAAEEAVSVFVGNAENLPEGYKTLEAVAQAVANGEAGIDYSSEIETINSTLAAIQGEDTGSTNDEGILIVPSIRTIAQEVSAASVSGLDEHITDVSNEIDKVSENLTTLTQTINVLNKTVADDVAALGELTGTVAAQAEALNVINGEEEGSINHAVVGLKAIIDDYTINNHKISENPILNSDDIVLNDNYSTINVDVNNIMPGEIITSAISKLEVILANTTLALTAALNDLDVRIGKPTVFNEDGSIKYEATGVYRTLEAIENRINELHPDE